MSGIGFVFGEVIAMGVLFQFTKTLSYEDAFSVAAVIVFGISIFLLFAVKDPDMKKLRKKIDLKLKNSPVKNSEDQVQFEEMGIFKKLVKLTSVVKYEMEV